MKKQTPKTHGFYFFLVCIFAGYRAHILTQEPDFLNGPCDTQKNAVCVFGNVNGGLMTSEQCNTIVYL